MILFDHITKSFDNKPILNDIELAIEQGELFTFLGPSGCGKTTLLRILAGLESPDQGRVWVDGHDITSIPPEKREISMVFQHYALFPNMNVEKNVAYGLKVRRISRDVIMERTKSLLNLVGMTGFEKRDISQLSGGEQQRIALVRALAVSPKVLLLDEPLSNLDANMRDRMRREIRALQKEVGITTIFVTHDQQEAMTMSDRIAVFHQGRLVQAGHPMHIYNEPVNEFVARFIGESNLVSCQVFPEWFSGVKEMKACIRPNALHIGGRGQVEAQIKVVEFTGSTVMYDCISRQQTIKVSVEHIQGMKPRETGEKVWLSVKDGAVHGLQVNS
ncbi:putative spermidine/putrescine transport system ATP-binding protein/thiamine transport system ATP-binding protein [Anoxynatronum buryatiense]|uniref:ABC-type quaternary amine transporter n=2 Tax=Anoxynatronum buryatiense TaxID=489973 RepID=A0AA46AKH1_9CLOT|nr:putative spermidine/putrescine transport system ATP-binding protein/thiamine transport system ATP-binding protein [Anoxynatronum buryatiense]